MRMPGLKGQLREVAPGTRDLVLAGILTLVVQQDLWFNADLGNLVGPRPVVASFDLVLTAALAWRRRWPLAVLMFVCVVGAVQFVTLGAPESLGAFLPSLVALYSVGRYAPTSPGLIALPVAALGTAVHDLRDPAFSWSGPTFFYWAVLAVAWPIGHAFHRREADLRRVAAHAATLEEEGDERMRQAAASERTRIARELHDVVGHGLSVVVLQLEAALGLLDASAVDAARQRLLATQRSARLALAEMRRLVGLLDDDDEAATLAPQPGLAELDRLLADTRAAGVTVQATTTGTRIELPPGLDLAAFRVTQEALTNVLRHARPPVVDLTIAYAPKQLLIEIADQGVAPAVSGGRTRTGRGISGMRERVALYGGDLEVGPRETGGYLVRARFPLERART
jgi:signal transduction histidine kinase